MDGRLDRVLDRLWIGAARDLDGTVPLAALGFVAVLDLRGGPPPAGLGVEMLRLTNRDGDPWKASDVGHALDFIHEHVRHGHVLVACAAGMSRSAAMVVGYLVRCGWSAPEALAHVKRARPKVAPVPSMLEAVLKLSGKGALP